MCTPQAFAVTLERLGFKRQLQSQPEDGHLLIYYQLLPQCTVLARRWRDDDELPFRVGFDTQQLPAKKISLNGKAPLLEAIFDHFGERMDKFLSSSFTDTLWIKPIQELGSEEYIAIVTSNPSFSLREKKPLANVPGKFSAAMFPAN